MAADIARTTSLPFIPKIIPFADGRAVFFCSNPSEATTVISIGIIKTQGIVVHLSKWNEKIDIIDPTTARFEGWIGIKGLPFNMWTKGIFEKISKWCGGLLEIDQQTMEYSNLAAAKIKVQANRVTDIPQTTFQKFEAQWLTLQVIPLFATHITTSNNDPPQQNTITDNPQAQRAIPIPNKQGQRVCQLNHNQKRSEHEPVTATGHYTTNSVAKMTIQKKPSTFPAGRNQRGVKWAPNGLNPKEEDELNSRSLQAQPTLEYSPNRGKVKKSWITHRRKTSCRSKIRKYEEQKAQLDGDTGSDVVADPKVHDPNNFSYMDDSLQRRP